MTRTIYKILLFSNMLLFGCVSQKLDTSNNNSCNLHSDCESNFCVSGLCLDESNQEQDSLVETPRQDAQVIDLNDLDIPTDSDIISPTVRDMFVSEIDQSMEINVDMDIRDLDFGEITSDMQVSTPTEVNLCSPCTNDAFCSQLGDDSRCTAIGEGSYCTSFCDEESDCPQGFTCLTTIEQCIPNNFECLACQQTPCSNGEVCNFNTGECGIPAGLCSVCNNNTGCTDGQVCTELEESTVCLQSCANTDNCLNNMTCTDGVCLPDSGVCEPCAGTCNSQRPYCIEEESRCAECGPTVPCGDGFRCDSITYTCIDIASSMCNLDTDCQGGYCRNGICVECLQDQDCPARHLCDPNTFTCEYLACAGVECQRGSSCDPSTGRCSPGCSSEMDCSLPDRMACNNETGQCYYLDGTCDLGGEAVCAPSSQCLPNALATLDPTLPMNCTCAKEDPTNPASPDRIACHPGQTCFDLRSTLGDFLPLDLEYEATCGDGF